MRTIEPLAAAVSWDDLSTIPPVRATAYHHVRLSLAGFSKKRVERCTRQSAHSQKQPVCTLASICSRYSPDRDMASPTISSLDVLGLMNLTAATLRTLMCFQANGAARDQPLDAAANVQNLTSVQVAYALVYNLIAGAMDVSHRR